VGPGLVVAEGERTKESARFAAFYASYVERAHRIAWRLVGGDAASAEDVVQDAFVKACRGLRDFRGEAELQSWFYRILLNEAHNHRRWRGLRMRFRALFTGNEVASSASMGSTDVGLRNRLGSAIGDLSRAQREVFVLMYLEELTVNETAELLERSPGTIKTHLHRALERLRAELADLKPEKDR